MTIKQAREVMSLEVDGIIAVRDRLGPELEQAVTMIMECPSRLVITGIGKSGIIGQKIAATLNSTGTPAFFLHPVEAMHGDLGMVLPTDVVLALSYSGETIELNGLLSSLQARSVSIIAMTGHRHSTLAACADVVLDVEVPGEACPLGLAPTTSTTASLALGDALAVVLLKRKKFKVEDFRRNHPGGSLGERLKVGVKEVMITGSDVPMVSEITSVVEAIKELDAKNLGAVIVINASNQLCGIVTDGDVRRLVVQRDHIDTLNIGEVMTPDPISIGWQFLAADALSIMQKHEITILPVTDEAGKLQGLLHLHNLLGKGEFRFLI